MPYTVKSPNLPSYVKSMPKKKKAAWAATWNSVYDQCLKDGGDTKACTSKAFSIANGNAKKQTLRVIPPQIRAIKKADSWSGAASNYASTDAYCAACLIDLNPPGQDKVQSLCKLPVRGPGDSSGTYVDKAVFAAAVRFGSMTQPAGVSAEAWAAAKKSAANKLLSAYGQMKAEAPDSLYAAAGKKAPAKKQTMNPIRQAWNGFIHAVNSDLGKENEVVERAVSFIQIEHQVMDALDSMMSSMGGMGGGMGGGGDMGGDGGDGGGDSMDMGGMSSTDMCYLIDVFYDNKNVFAIVSQCGKFYQIPLTVSDTEVKLGTPQQVAQAFAPVKQTVRIIRQAGGLYRFVGVAATSVLNRVAEIDSRELFDSFMEDTAQTGEWPTLDFYHMGRYSSSTWEFGTIDYQTREDYCYIVSGLLDPSHPLAQATIRAFEEDPSKWGFSIEFYALGDAEVFITDPEVRIPVYKKGRILRVSIVRERDAASLFTRIGNITEEKTRMRRDTQEALAELFGSDEAAQKFLTEFGVGVDDINRTITDNKLVARSQTSDQGKEETADETTETEEEETAETSEEPLLELDEEAMSELGRQVMSAPEFKLIAQSLVKIQSQLEEMAKARMADAKAIADLQAATVTTGKRLAVVEKSETVKKQEYQQDMPTRTTRKATFRPREAYSDEDEADDDFADKAQRTLAKLPTRY